MNIIKRIVYGMGLFCAMIMCLLIYFIDEIGKTKEDYATIYRG